MAELDDVPGAATAEPGRRHRAAELAGVAPGLDGDRRSSPRKRQKAKGRTPLVRGKPGNY